MTEISDFFSERMRYREWLAGKKDKLREYNGRCFVVAEGGNAVYICRTHKDAEDFRNRFYRDQFVLVGTLPELEQLTQPRMQDLNPTPKEG